MTPADLLASLTAATGLPGYLTGNGVAITLLGRHRYVIEIDDLITMTAAPRQAGGAAVPFGVEIEPDEPGTLDALVACIQFGERDPEPPPVALEDVGPETVVYAQVAP